MIINTVTISIDASRYADSEDCLTDAASDIASERDLHGWDLSPRWEDDERAIILVDVPAYAVATDDDIDALISDALEG